MTTLEATLRRSRAFSIASTVLFLLFCFGGGDSSWLFPGPASDVLRRVGYICGILAWSFMCMAYDLRRKAL